MRERLYPALCGAAMVVVEDAAEPLSTHKGSIGSRFLRDRHDVLVPQSLVRPLFVIVRDVLANAATLTLQSRIMARNAVV